MHKAMSTAKAAAWETFQEADAKLLYYSGGFLIRCSNLESMIEIRTWKA